jgi:hypothetical protein
LMLQMGVVVCSGVLLFGTLFGFTRRVGLRVRRLWLAAAL